MTTQFTITAADRQIKEVVCTTPSITIGRSTTNDIQLQDPKVSRFHCRVEQTDQGFMLVDLRSKNGSYVNGVRCETALITKNDILKIGNNTFDLNPAPINEIEQQERTREFHALPWVPPQAERTREINLQGPAGPDTSRERVKLSLAGLLPNRAKYIQFAKNNKFYVAASIIFCLPLIALSANFYTHSSPLSSDPAATSNPQSPSTSPQASETQATKNIIPPKDIEKATQLAREADTIFELGDFNQAIALYNKALDYDAENILAKQGISVTEAYVENLASICFTRGQKCLLAFDYTGAVKEFETVVLLLEKQPNHKLYLDANKLIKQSQLKVSH